MKLSIAPALLYFDYTEYAINGTELNSENGLVPGVELKTEKSLNDQYTLDVSAGAFSGEVDYIGTTRSGLLRGTTSDIQLQQLGTHLHFKSGINTDLGIGFSYHRWRRHLQTRGTVSGLLEKYRWLELSTSIRHRLWQRNQDQLQTKFAIVYIHNPLLHVDLSSADFGTTELQLESKYGADIELEWRHEVNSHTNYSLGMFYKLRKFGKGDSNITTGGSTNISIFGPDSETRIRGINASYTVTF